MDIKGYYTNMSHEEAKKVLAKFLEPRVMERASAILDKFPGDVGFNPGSQIIQIVGISFLNELDHYIKERLRVKHYVRYMDDMIILGETEDELQNYTR